jgi:hypothetical protein
MTWSSTNNSVDSCWFCESLIPVMSCFCHLVMLNNVEANKPAWRNLPGWEPTRLRTAVNFCEVSVIRVTV